MSDTLSIEQGAAALDAALARDQVKPRSNGDGRDAAIESEPRIVALEIGDLLVREFTPMASLLDPWLKRQTLSMVYAWRGVGKTHFCLGIAYAVASGGSFLKWSAPEPRRVLYIDGEMPGIAMKERLGAIVEASGNEPPPGYLRVITPDVQELPLPDLGTEMGQRQFNAILGDAELIIVDNLSTLVRSGVENEGESWLPVADWALARRREGRAVLFVHHANKSGSQRGSNRREDILDCSINLRHPPDYKQEDGAHFIVRFEKARGLVGEEVREIEANLTTSERGVQLWTWSEAEKATGDRVIELAKLGMMDSEIATELCINRSTAFRHRKWAEAQGILRGGT